MMGITFQKTMLLVDEEMIEISGMAADNFKKLAPFSLYVGNSGMVGAYVLLVSIRYERNCAVHI